MKYSIESADLLKINMEIQYLEFAHIVLLWEKM